MAKRKQKEDSSDDSRLFAFIATFLSIIGFIIALIFKKEDKYVMFYAKQSLGLFIVYLISLIAMIIPLIGDFISRVMSVVFIVLWIFSWIYSLSGKTKKVPIVGKYADKIDL